ncbi:MAG: MarR family transcriptional regulator [Eggerthellaceae bacterium]|nr:MarR family transcriptional regulator [Eggerthellaceae bacterium]
MFVTSDLMTYGLNYDRSVAHALRSECGLSITEYRMLAFLSDHVSGTGPSALARTLSTSPATVTVSANDLAKRGLVERVGHNGRELRITKAGIDLALDADVVLAQTHEEYFSALTPQQKAVVDTGSIITNKNLDEGNRMRQGHFFSAFETLHAFLLVEDTLTKSAHAEGLSVNGFRILFELEQRGGQARIGAIGEHLVLSSPTMTYAVGKLEDAGLVTRGAQPGDRRSASVSITDAGRAVFARALERVEAVYTTDIRASSATERDSYKDAAAIVASSLRRRFT